MKRFFGTLLLLLIVATGFCKSPKYIFYFIGDGMGPSHVRGTELFVSELFKPVHKKDIRLIFTGFPQVALVTTHSASNGVTDSAASGTALATGSKANNGYIGVDANGEEVYSIAHKAKEKGLAVGIATTVPINHATPAAFYAHNKSRNNYHEIAQWMLTAGYDFYAGGDAKCTNEQREVLYNKAEEQGYTIARGYSDYKAKADDAEKMMLYQKNVSEELPYAIDNEYDNVDLNLYNITRAGIEFLYNKNKDGFFFMVEGGKIDYASHSDDAATVFHEVVGFNSAIDAAMEFYNQHKEETLIIVTADHETGGLVLGYNGNYALYFNELTKQNVSVGKLQAMLGTLGTTTWGKVNEIVKENTGVEIRKKHDSNESVEVTSDLAGRIAAEAIYDVDRKAAISWASGNHSGTYVPLYAIGCGAEEFHGVMDNTDIPKTIEKVAELSKENKEKRRKNR
jgi:alkaline phosphatase